MNALISRAMHPTTQTDLRPAALVLTLPTEPAESACGWFDSSWELRQGLAVSELPDSDMAVAALWFHSLAGSASVASVPWQ